MIFMGKTILNSRNCDLKTRGGFFCQFSFETEIGESIFERMWKVAEPKEISVNILNSKVKFRVLTFLSRELSSLNLTDKLRLKF